MKIIVFLILMFSFGCSHLQEMTSEEKNQFGPIQQKFIDESRGKYSYDDISHVNIHLKEYKNFNIVNQEWEIDASNTAGTCYPLFFETYVTINRHWWYDSKTSNYDKQQVIFHELGHCLIKKEHVVPTSSDNWSGKWERFLFKIGLFKEKQRYLPDLCPSSIMDPNMMHTYCFVKHYDYYMDELFDRTTRERYENGH